MTETIAAISTAPGTGGIAVLRVSGPNAIEVAGTVVGDLSNIPTRQAVLRRTELDEMVVTLFRAPHSFTGEDTVEIACHGSLYIQQQLLNELCRAGARLARGGEFTQRAFLNGKMDLSQAEAVADLIASESQAEQQLALRQLRGGISSELQKLRAKLLDLTSLLELELDFSDHEDVEFADRRQLHQLLEQIVQHTNQLTESFRAGNAIRNGIRVAIVGPTNAGKSTLLNAILGENRAIVSDIHGTTRDTIEEVITLDGIRYRLIDTAGLRETSDRIEQLGIERSREAIEKADIIVAVDCPEPETEQVGARQIVLKVHNKCDISQMPGIINISAKQKEITPLLEALKQAGLDLTASNGNTLISNSRHYEALRAAQTALKRVQEGLDNNLSGELVAMDLHEVLNQIGSITGEVTNTEVLSNIFSKFCIGK